jgi:sulfoxide reductase heme-binding subunit YedZ
MPFNGGVKLQHTLGILAFEGMLAASIVVGVRRWLSYRQWLGIHRISYVAFGCGVVHAFFGALNSGSLSTLWLAGITLLVPTVTIALVRFVPSRALSSTGIYGDEP